MLPSALTAPGVVLAQPRRTVAIQQQKGAKKEAGRTVRATRRNKTGAGPFPLPTRVAPTVGGRLTIFSGFEHILVT